MDKELSYEGMQKSYEEFWRQPSLEKYVAHRSNYRCDIAPDFFCRMELLPLLVGELESIGVSPELVADVIEGNDLQMDVLALQLIGTLIERRRLEIAGRSHLQSRKEAAPDALIDYLILIALASCSSHSVEPPSSLLVLIMDRIGGLNPSRLKKFKANERKREAIWIAASQFSPDESISIRQIAKKMKVEPSTVLRWFAGGELEAEVERIHRSLNNPQLLKRILSK